MITGNFALDWALISVSLFNSILLFWLGLTVFLNTERRTWGVGLLGGALLLGALFFISHTVMLGHHMTTTVSWGLDFWWQVGWFPVVLSPYLWHVTVLWYTGYWDNPATSLHRRHRFGLFITTTLALGLVIFMMVAHALPTYTQIAYRNTADVPTLGGIPLLFLLYPPFVFLSITLPIDALVRPEPSARMMGDLARRRALPWLIGTSAVLVSVGVLITGFFTWALNGYRVLGGIYFGWENEIAIFDLVLASLLSLAILMLGQAIVSYEIFTGKALPRRGLFQYWRSMILLAAGYAILGSWSVIYQPRPIYSVLLAAIVMIVFYALFGWRSFIEREQYMARLRPFVSSQRLMRGFWGTGNETVSIANIQFHAICASVLNATRARLIPLGVLAPLVSEPLTYACTNDDHNNDYTIDLPPTLFTDPGTGVLRLDAAQNAGLEWAIPLWSERGLLGALLLGPKQDEGFYAQEEIDIARASAERIIDMLAGEQIAQRLKEIQRRRFAETRVLDLRTRRTLHDDILPELHMIALRLSGLGRSEPAAKEAIQALTQVHHQISDLIHTSSGMFTAHGDQDQLAQALQDLIAEEFAGAFDTVTWDTTPLQTNLDPLLHEVVYNAAREAVRNAAVHGRGDQPDRPLMLQIAVHQTNAHLIVNISDNGIGIMGGTRHASESPAGSGGGLLLHSTMLAIAGGELNIETPVEGGTRVIITIPV